MRFAEQIRPKHAALALAAAMLGGWWGLSAIAEIDPRYYAPDPPRERRVPQPSAAGWAMGGTVAPPTAYPVEPVVIGARREFDLGMRIPPVPRFVDEEPRAPVYADTRGDEPEEVALDEPSCRDCGGPYEPVEEDAVPEPYGDEPPEY